jgi:hypothetical protein
VTWATKLAIRWRLAPAFQLHPPRQQDRVEKDLAGAQFAGIDGLPGRHAVDAEGVLHLRLTVGLDDLLGGCDAHHIDPGRALAELHVDGALEHRAHAQGEGGFLSQRVDHRHQRAHALQRPIGGGDQLDAALRFGVRQVQQPVG